MRIRFPVILLAGLVAGCSADRAPQQQLASAAVAPGAPVAAAVNGAMYGAMSGGVSLMAEQAQRVAGSFASLPDHGALLAYDTSRKVARGGAYTWHPVKLSESHALNAIGAGRELALTAPNGQPIRLQYVRHVEHDNGNWSWIGRAQGAQPGTEAIMTFGDKAAFGVIPQRQGGTLRLNIGGGQAWMIETDQAMLARLDSARTGPRAPDHLVPPRELLRKRLGNGAVTDALVAKLEAAALSTKADATNTVDVLLGYTNGFATRLGGQSQANTRLTFMVQVANEAMAASLIPGRLRLVHTLQVTYPDNTSNQDALYALTGVSCTENSNGSLTCTDVAPPAALQPLHTARNTYGADLVSLVRVFNEPENESCGIAWLNGAGRTPITSSDAPGGMSVVSDSSGQIFPDNQRYCREATLAHELGHNMGSAHDRDTSDGDDNILQSNEYGRYDYSFGYRTSTAGNLFTVMAYGDSGQDELNRFSNPRQNTCKDVFPCGVTNQADNAQSLTNTMPIIVTFRSAVQEANVALMPQIDANADNRSDVFWHNPTLEKIQPWLMNGTSWAYGAVSPIGNIYRVAAVGDFNGDRRADIIWRDINRTVLWEWQARATGGYNIVKLRSFPAGWDIGGVGDVNRDGRSDLIWHSPSLEKFQVWLMNGTTWTYGAVQSRPGAFVMIGSGDFNGDGYADLLWRDAARTAVSVSMGTASATVGPAVTLRSYPPGYEVVGLRRANADTRSDIFWHSTTAGRLQAWYMNGTAFSYGLSHPVGPIFRVTSMGDYNGDGLSDVMWHDTAKTRLYEWQAKPDGTYTVTSLRPYPAGWTVVH